MNWIAECKDELTYEWLYREAKKALASDGIEFTGDGKIIVGGFRLVGQFEILEDDESKCPSCGECYSERPALSRKDNETEICPDCGIKEALEDMRRGG